MSTVVRRARHPRTTGPARSSTASGNPNYNNTGCEIENSTVCVGNTHSLWQVTTGFWDRPYSPKFGRFQWGIQYSYTERRIFPGYGYPLAGGNPNATGRDNMIFTSVRFYPF
jgi:hypothetical protein